MAPSWIPKPTERIVVNTTPAASSFLPDALPVATLQIYPGLGPVQGTAGFGPVTFEHPVAWLCS